MDLNFHPCYLIFSIFFLRECSLPDCWNVSYVVPVYKSVRTVNYCPRSLFALGKILKNVGNNRINRKNLIHLNKSSLSPCSQYDFESYLTIGFLTGPLEFQHLIYPRFFGTIWYADPLHKFKSDGTLGLAFGLISLCLSNRCLYVIVNDMSLQKYSASVPKGSILCCTVFLLCISDLPDDAIFRLLSMLMILMSTQTVIWLLMCDNS